MAIIAFAAYFTLQSWLPSLMVVSGVSLREAPTAAAALGTGGLFGGVVLATISAYGRVHKLIFFFILVAVAFLVTTGLASVSRSGLLALLGGVGAGLLASCNGSTTAAIRSYSDRLRTTGLAWTGLAGRVGRIVGPSIGGFLVAINISVDALLLWLAVPLVIAAVLALTLGRGSGSGEPDTTVTHAAVDLTQ